MSDHPKASDPFDAEAHRHRDLHRVSETLKELVASLRSERERHAVDGHHPTPLPGPEADRWRLVAELREARMELARAAEERARLTARIAELEAERWRVAEEVREE